MKNTEAAGEKTIEDDRCVKRGFTEINLLRRFRKRAGEKTHGSSCKMTQLSLFLLFSRVQNFWQKTRNVRLKRVQRPLPLFRN